MISEDIKLFGEDGAYMTSFITASSQHNEKRLLPAILIAPGGAYLGTSDREAEDVALAFASKGFQAFVLRYSCGEKAKMPRPVLEGLKAISIIRERAKQWRVNPDKIAVCGFSAEGHLCSCLATMWHRHDLCDAAGTSPEGARPNAAILCYPAIALPWRSENVNTGIPKILLKTMLKKLGNEELAKEVFIENGKICYNLPRSMQRHLAGRDDFSDEDLLPWSSDLAVTEKTAPSFVWTTTDDDLVPVSNVIKYVLAMIEAGSDIEYHQFAHGCHGLSLANELTADSPAMINPEVAAWFELSVSWLRKRFESAKD